MSLHIRGLTALPVAECHRLQAGAEHLCRLGSRAVAELLLELAERQADVSDLLATLDQARRRLSGEMLATTGGNCMPSSAIRRVA